jgi:hypothetical protein
MREHHLSRISRDIAVEQSLDAALELTEYLQGIRQQSPALEKLTQILIGTQPVAATVRNELLSNAQMANLSSRAISPSADSSDKDRLLDIVELLAKVHSLGLNNFSNSQIEILREFCLGINRELVSEAYERVPSAAFSRNIYNKTFDPHASS